MCTPQSVGNWGDGLYCIITEYSPTGVGSVQLEWHRGWHCLLTRPVCSLIKGSNSLSQLEDLMLLNTIYLEAVWVMVKIQVRPLSRIPILYQYHYLPSWVLTSINQHTSSQTRAFHTMRICQISYWEQNIWANKVYESLGCWGSYILSRKENMRETRDDVIKLYFLQWKCGLLNKQN